MGYWGAVVVAQPPGLLVDQDGVAGFGHQHWWLRELGDGWQMLEATGFDDPPELRGPCEAVVASTGQPVFAAYDWPFSAFTNSYGPAFWARSRAKHRADGDEEPEPWEAQALALEAELWASLYRPGIDVVALARRAAHLAAAHPAARKSAAPAGPPVLDQRDREALAAFESRWVSGVVPRWSVEFDARGRADARAADPAPADSGVPD